MTAVSSDGLIQNFLPICKDEGPYSVIDTHQVEKNPIKAADYSCDGQNFTVAADDKNVYAYDIVTGQQKLAMAKNRHVPNHSNIISCLRHHPTDPNLFVTGAWDSSIKLFDLRSKGPLSSLMTKGPICGDSVDLFDDMIVAGSYSSSKNCMQMFSFSRQCLVHEWSFNQRKPDDLETGYVMATKFTKDGQYIMAGGAALNEVKVWANEADSFGQFTTQFEMKSLPGPVFDIDVSPSEDQYVLGLEGGKSYMCNYYQNEQPKHVNYNDDFDSFALKASQKKKASEGIKPCIGLFLSRPDIC